MFMTNIPRRKIYEQMLIFEDGMIDMQIIIFNEENFRNFSERFNTESLPKIKSSYIEVKALIVMFLENRKYEKEEDFQKDLHKFINDEEKINEILMENPNIAATLKKSISKLDLELKRFKKVNDLDEAKFLYQELDKFNDIIPRFLELRRDFMK